MASRYWVGGSADWNATAGTKWATTSGGAGGAAAPTSADDVFFDGNSGAVTVSMPAASVNCGSLNCTGFTGTLTNLGAANDINCYGSVTLGGGMTWSLTGGAGLVIRGTCTLTTNGIATLAKLSALAGSITLGDACSMTGPITVEDTFTLNTNGFALTTTDTATGIQCSLTGNLTMGASTVTTPKITMGAGGTLNFGSGTLVVNGTGTCVSINATTTITAGTGTLKITNSSSSTKTLSLQGKTYYNIWLAHGSTGTVTIQGSNTFNDYKITSTTGAVLHTAGTTQTVSSIDWNGSAGNLVTVRSTSNGSAWNISKSSGTVTVTFCSIRDSAAGGGATFNANNSTNVSGNTGWIFPTTGLFGFGRLLPF